MKKILLLTILALLMAACGGNEPLTVAQIRETAEAEATVAAEDFQATLDAREALIGSIAPEGTTILAEPERTHDETVNYPFGGLPPAGGVHHPQWQKCEAYPNPVLPQYAIHAMEHGGVWITYNPDDVNDTDISNLEGYTRGEPFVLVSPYPDQDSPVVVSAWGLQLVLDSSSDGRIREFVDAYANGPQTPEPGANCAGGVGTMVDS